MPYGLYPDPYQPYPAFGGYHQPALTPFETYPGLMLGAPPILQHQPPFGFGSVYPAGGGSPFGPYPPNSLYGASSPQTQYFPSSANSFSPSYGPPGSSYPSGGSYPSSASGSYYPSTSPVVASSPNVPYQPTAGLIPDPFGSVAPPAIGSPSYKPPQITIIDGSSYSNHNPSYSSPGSTYKPGSGQGDGYDAVVINAQGSYDQQPYKPSNSFVSGGYKPQATYNRPSTSSSSYRPSSTYSQGNRPSIQGSIQEIPNIVSYYTSSSQNKPTFYSASSDQLLFPREWYIALIATTIANKKKILYQHIICKQYSNKHKY